MISWHDVAVCPDTLLDQFRQPGLVVLCGSGISLFAPTQLSTGQEFRSLVVNDVTSCTALSNLSLCLVHKIPMENVFECCPNPERLAVIVRSVFNSAQNNPVHDLLAAKLADKHISNIITTNYDLCLDQALKNQAALFERVGTEREAATKSRLALYFKIHGSTDILEPGGLVFQLRGEAQLPPNKLSLFLQLVTGQRLVIVGYSGFDFDICPVLANKPAQILWNFFHRDEISPGAAAILENCSYTAVEGDMGILLSRLFRLSVSLNRSTGTINSSILSNEFTLWEKAIWTLRLLNEIGCPVDAGTVGELALQTSTTDQQRELVLSETARAHFHQGQYRKSISAYQSSLRITRTQERRCELFLEQCDVYRVMGAPIRSIVAWVRAKGLRRGPPDPGMITLLHLKKILILRDWDRALTAIGFGWLAKYLRKRAENSIRIGIATARQAGRWHDVQQFGYWTSRFSFSDTIARSAEGLTPPPAGQGYEHLGYVVAQFMAFRDVLRNAPRPPAYKIIQQGIEFSNKAEQMCAWPEAWKLLELVMRVSPAERNDSRNFQVRARLSHCEYTRLGKRLVWLLVP